MLVDVEHPIVQHPFMVVELRVANLNFQLLFKPIFLLFDVDFLVFFQTFFEVIHLLPLNNFF